MADAIYGSATHAVRHQNGGVDEVNITALSGILTDIQLSRQIIQGGTKDTMAAGATEYIALDVHETATAGVFGAEGPAKALFAIAGTLKNFRIDISDPPGAGENIAVTLRDSGGDSAVTITISDTAQVGSDLTHELVVSAADWVSLKFIKSGGCAADLGHKRWSIEFDPD